MLLGLYLNVSIEKQKRDIPTRHDEGQNNELIAHKSEEHTVVGKVTVTPLQSYQTSYFLWQRGKFSLHFK
jgi:hypothetical protein